MMKKKKLISIIIQNLDIYDQWIEKKEEFEMN